jgi:hypothetical protein
MRNASNLSVRKLKKMRSRRKWENNIRLDFKEVECEGVEWSGFSRLRI